MVEVGGEGATTIRVLRGMITRDEKGGRMDGDNETRLVAETAALVPRREQAVDFYGDAIPVAQTPDGGLYVALRPITDFLGLDFSAQRRRVLRDEVIAPRSPRRRRRRSLWPSRRSGSVCRREVIAKAMPRSTPNSTGDTASAPTRGCRRRTTTER